jgi:uncharacterized protein YkwD
VFLAGVLLLGAAPSAGAARSELAPASTCAGQADAAAPAAQQLAAMRCLINWARRSHGLRPLRPSAALNRSAGMRADAIRRCRQFSHAPCGQRFLAVFQRVGYTRRGFTVGENLGWGEGSLASARSIVAAWLRSPPHRANLLAGGFRDVGLVRIDATGVFGSGAVGLWVCQFGRRS